MLELPIIEIKIESNNNGVRLDSFLSANYLTYSRSAWAQMVKAGKVLVNGERSKPSLKLKEGDKLLIDLKGGQCHESLEACDLKYLLDVIYEDQSILVINKQAGLVVHPGSGNVDQTLVAMIKKERPEIFDAFGGERPGIVHRLDKETSGVMVIAKTKDSFEDISAQILNREIKKEYRAIVFGQLESKSGNINVPIKRQIVDRKKMGVSSLGRESFTEYSVEEEFGKYSLVKAYPLTGRTHQIRVHLAFVGNPVVGDKFYSSRVKQKEVLDVGIDRHMLHAYRLGLKNPSTGKFQEFVAPIPKDFSSALTALKSL